MEVSCFPFMKYVLLLTLFVISFILMYSTRLELLGLGVFFAVNAMYSAMLGMDLSTFFSRAFSGEGDVKRWMLVIAGVLVVGLVLTFVASVLTMMTLGNMHSKFGVKGEKILFSGETRKEMDHIEGMFVAIIVLMTVLSLRMYFTPEEMTKNAFEWTSALIPSLWVKIGHFLLCILVLGLAFTMIGYINRVPKYTRGDNVALSDESAFVSNFKSLFSVLMGVSLLYIVPVFFGMPGIGGLLRWVFGITAHPSGMPNWTNSDYNQISLFSLLKIMLILLLLIVLPNVSNAESGDIRNGYIIGSTFLVITILSVVLSRFGDFARQIGTWIGDIPTALTFFISSSILIRNKLQTPQFAKTEYETSHVYYSILLTIFMVWPILMLVIASNGFRANGFSTTAIFNLLATLPEALTNTYLLNISDAFYLMKMFLLCLAVIFAGFTINEYRRIDDPDKYQSFYHLKEVFGLFIVFALLVIAMSLIHPRHIPRILTVLLDYLAPVGVLVLACFLVFFSNDLSKLSSNELIDGVSREEETKKYLEDVPQTVVGRQVYDGSTPVQI